MIGEKFLEPVTDRVFKVIGTHAKRAWLVNDDDGAKTFRTMHFDRLGNQWRAAKGITEFDMFKTPAGHWIVLIRSTSDFDYTGYNPGPRIWYETDGTGEAGLAHQIRASMR